MRPLALVLLVAACIVATAGGRRTVEPQQTPPPYTYVAAPDGQLVVCAGGWAVARVNGKPLSWRCP